MSDDKGIQAKSQIAASHADQEKLHDEGEMDIIPDPPEQTDHSHTNINNAFYDEEEAMANGESGMMSIEMPMLGIGMGEEGIKGEAWDDRELIDAWEVAREEFELHNPGPGSWLDKQTAALALGKHLAGAKESSIGSKWYTSTPPRSRNDHDHENSNAGTNAQGSTSISQTAAQTGKKKFKGKGKNAHASGSTTALPVVHVPVPETSTGESFPNDDDQAQTRSIDPTTNTLDSLLGLSGNVSANAPAGQSASGSGSGQEGKRRREGAGLGQGSGGSLGVGAQGDGGDGMDWEDDNRPPKRSRVAFASDAAQGQAAPHDLESPSQAYRAVSPAYQPPSPSAYGPSGTGTADQGSAHGPQVPSDIAAGRLSMARGKNALQGQAGGQSQNINRGKGKGKNKAGNPYATANGNGINPYSFSNPAMAGPSKRSSAPDPVVPGSRRPSPPAPASVDSSLSHSPPHAGYPPNATGVYPEMGGQPVTRAFSSGSSMSREEASVRAVNAQWWAGYWHAMTEVLPSEMEYRSQGQ